MLHSRACRFFAVLLFVSLLLPVVATAHWTGTVHLHNSSPSYQLPTVPTIPVPSYRVPAPAAPTYRTRRYHVNPRDYTRQFQTSPTIQRQWQRNDDAVQRNRWAACAKYNRFCVNMLRSLDRR